MAPLIRHIDFNSQQDCFVVSTDDGLRIFNCDPLTEIGSVGASLIGTVGVCSILHRTNLLAMVSGGLHPKFADNTVMIWDNAARKFVLEVTVGGKVLNVILSYTRLVIVQENRLHIFAFPDKCQLLRTEITHLNPQGLAALSSDTKTEFLVFPGFKTGSVQVLNLQNLVPASSLAPNVIQAHRTEIARITLNIQATLLATGSTKGTVVRVFDTRTRSPVAEFRRGSDPANLHCLRFSPCSSFLAVSSDKGTVHIFTVRGDKTDGKWGINRKTLLQQVMSDDVQRNCAQFSLSGDVATQIAFGSNSGGGGGNKKQQAVIAICTDATYHRFVFVPFANCTRDAFDHFLDLADEQDFWITGC